MDLRGRGVRLDLRRVERVPNVREWKRATVCGGLSIRRRHAKRTVLLLRILHGLNLVPIMPFDGETYQRPPAGCALKGRASGAYTRLSLL
jgi:hypothetical protein